MLEHVALGQSRFITPGVAPDPRGVILGRFALLVFPTLEGVVSWFRLYSAESSLDDLIPGMQITRARTPLASREMLLKIPASSSYAVDRAARCANLVGGTTYTGTTKHFVKYRDERSPYGYDATEISALPAGADLMIHGEDFTQTYTNETALGFERLLFRLSLRHLPGGDRLSAEDRNELIVVIERGLADGVMRYLWRNRVEAEVGLARPQARSAFDDHGGGEGRGYLIGKVTELPERILDLFLATPGIDVFRPVAGNVGIQVGYRHIIDLGSCATVFDQERFYLFWGRGDRVDVIDGPLELSAIEHLTRIEIDLERPPVDRELSAEAAAIIGVDVQLAPSLNPPRKVVGALIPNEKAPWVKRLVYALPRSSLRGHRVAVTDHGILIIASGDIDIVPLGQPLAELAPGLLVPLGMDLVPRVAPDVLARTLGHGAGLLTIFPHRGNPFQVNETDLAPLERRALAKIEVDRGLAVDVGLEDHGDPSVVNDPVGRFALWGFRAPRRKQLKG
jgi:hypothetical protein